MNQQTLSAEVDFIDDEMVSLYLESIDRYFDLPLEIFQNADVDVGKRIDISFRILNAMKRDVVDEIGGFIKNPKKQELL